MEDWQPENQQLLQFDFNTCTERDLCEVFNIELGLARRLFQCRSEAMHIFDLQDLLKVEGVSPEMLQLWCSPPSPDPAGFSPELRQLLGAQADGSVPLPKLMETVSSIAGANACLLAARDGSVLFQNGDGSATLQTLAPRIPELLESIHGDLLQMNVGTARCQIINCEQSDVVVAPTSAFFLLVLLPSANRNPSRLSLWQATAAEINRRLPPRFYVDNHARETTADIAFDCPNCVLRILVDSSAIGYTFPCPRCQTPVTVPPQSTSGSSYYEGQQGEPSPNETVPATDGAQPPA